MRTVSACACARVQSRLNTAVAAAEPFSSGLREVGIALLRGGSSFHYRFSICLAKYLEDTSESQHEPRSAPAPRSSRLAFPVHARAAMHVRDVRLLLDIRRLDQLACPGKFLPQIGRELSRRVADNDEAQL